MWNTGPDVSEGINCLDIDKLWLDIGLLLLDCMQSTHRVSSTLVVPILSVHAEAGLTLTFTLSKLDIIASSHWIYVDFSAAIFHWLFSVWNYQARRWSHWQSLCFKFLLHLFFSPLSPFGCPLLFCKVQSPYSPPYLPPHLLLPFQIVHSRPFSSFLPCWHLPLKLQVWDQASTWNTSRGSTFWYWHGCKQTRVRKRPATAADLAR